jgi:Dolichyl-phosphate-mannose-protein mannosyltransferase
VNPHGAVTQLVRDDRLEGVGAGGAPAPTLPIPGLVPVRRRGRRIVVDLDRTRYVALRRAGWWAAAHWQSLALLTVLLLGAGFVHGTGMFGWPSRFDDEGTYVSQAWSLQHYGALSHYTYWYDHPPLGWMTIALWRELSSGWDHAPNAVANGRELFLGIQLVSCALVYAIARRIRLSRLAAAAAVTLFAACPLAVEYHRMVTLDNIAMMWVLAAFALVLTPRRRLWAFALAGACCAAAVLCKEYAVLMVPAVAYAAWQNSDRRTRGFCVTLFASLLVLLGSMYLLFALLKGELLAGGGHVSLEDGIRFQLFERASSGSIFDPHSLSRQTLNGWLDVDELLLAGAVIATLPALVMRRTRAVALAFAIQLAMLARPGYLPALFVTGLLPFAALIVAGTGDALARWRPSRVAIAGPALALALTAAALVVAVPPWAAADRQRMTVDADAPMTAAQHWVLTHVDRRSRVITDNNIWLDLIERKFGSSRQPGGFYSDRVIWYWKLDLDPAVQRRFPGGWRDFDYVVSSEYVRATLNLVPETAQAIRHSRVVAQFGRGPHRVEIRRIVA